MLYIFKTSYHASVSNIEKEREDMAKELEKVENEAEVTETRRNLYIFSNLPLV